MPKSNVADTSIEAYMDILQDLSNRQAQVYDALETTGPASNTMIANYLQLPINCITGRIYELRNDKKVVGFAFKNKCLVTGKNAIYWKVLRR